jgi:BirA family biotin operon repressor/biotin-[acetyl-CoA-carboxylase] ligase
MNPFHLSAKQIWLEETDSTNRALRRHIGDYDSLSFLAAYGQTAGRGQGDHTWFSTPGKNLTFSYLLRYSEFLGHPLATDDALLITCVTTLGIRDYLLTHGVKADIKWPNDIWVDGKKICGILIENILEDGAIRESIIGVGLNLNETGWPEELPNPVSLTELTGKTYDPAAELEALSNEICRRCAMLAQPDGSVSLQEEFGKYMFRLSGEAQP